MPELLLLFTSVYNYTRLYIKSNPHLTFYLVLPSLISRCIPPPLIF